jgi:hypothetical protein
VLPLVVLSGDDIGYDAAYRLSEGKEAWRTCIWRGADGARTPCKSCFCVDEALSFVEIDARSQAR